MIHPLLQKQLLKVFRRQRRLNLALSLALCWCGLAMLGVALVQLHGARSWLFVLVGLAVVVGAMVIARHRRAKPDWCQIARRIELHHPELNGLLLTAAQQQPVSDGQFDYLQERIARDAWIHAKANRWTAAIPSSGVAAAQLAHLLALLLFVAVLALLWSPPNRKSMFANGWTADGVTITPGDASIERGERLVVVASFDGSVPANVDLITTLPSAQSARTPLVKSLSDPVFGGSISEVTTDLVYRVEYGRKHTRDFTVKVFEFPRLERADADLTFPDYTGLPPKRIENTHRVSAVEGTRCTLTLHLNKPVTRAQFVAKGDTTNVIPLAVVSNNPVATLARLPFETNRTYLLQLVDADGRTNKLPAQFVVDVLKNREPELKIASPRGDTRPSPLEEVSFEGTVWDDFGVQAYGLAYTESGGEIKFVELGQRVPANEKRAFKHLLRLEDLGAKPDQLITWFLWADDIGPDGQVRRSAGDMYFAEVRPFDEVFRQGQGGGGEQQAGAPSGGGGASRQSQLSELQKQIINATWKLQRQKHQSPAPLRKQSSRRPLPEGESKIAQRFSVGFTSAKTPSPEGTAEATSSATEASLRSSRLCGSLPYVTHLTHLTYLTSVAAQPAFAQPAPADPPPTPPLSRVRDNLSKLSGTNKPPSASQFVEDLSVVRDAVAQGITQAQAARERQSDPRNSALWDDLLREMEKSQAALDKAAQSPPSLSEALAAEQAAFQVLLKLQQRDYEVSRNRNRSQSGQSSRDRQMQRQLDQLDLTQPENRYENERLAQSPQSPERREQLQVMNRLGELARRQQDLNNRLKELQTALQEARTEQEREEIRRQLKRLQEEEQRMLADVDELQQRMNQAENQSRMSEQRQQLDQTRQEMQRASEAAQQGAASQALASGTRAQRQLQQMREDMRKQNSSQFAEDLKQLRADARDAERKQQEIQKQMDSLSGSGPKTLDDSSERQKSLEQLAQQSQRLTNLVNRATQLSQQTEEAEPLASRELYDGVRKFSQEDTSSVRRAQDDLIEHGMVRTELFQRLSRLEKEDGAKSVELTSEMLRQGLLSQARQAGDRTASAVRDLKQGIERAAEKVIGDDTEALRLAQQQLDQLTGQLEREMAPPGSAGVSPASSDKDKASPASQNSTNNSNALSSQNRTNSGSQSGQRAGARPQPGTGRQPDNQNQISASGESQPPQNESQPADGADQQNDGSQAGSTASANNQRNNPSPRNGAPQRGGNTGRVPAELEQFLNSGRGGDGNGNGNRRVITGEDFVPWSDRLREVEEIVDDPRLQNQLATARERARVMRQEYKRTLEKPEWTLVRSQVVKPLVEVRDQIAEELARRGSQQNLVPIDRDPVPNRFSELVRRYYEELGKDK